MATAPVHPTALPARLTTRRWEHALIVLGICLPVPLLAATGLSIPLPSSVERIAASFVPWTNTAALEQNEALAGGQKGAIVHGPGERPRTASTAAPSAATNPRVETTADPPSKAGGGSKSDGRGSTGGGGSNSNDSGESGGSGGSSGSGGSGGSGGSTTGGQDPTGPTSPVQAVVDQVDQTTAPVVDDVEGTVTGVVDTAGDTVDGVVTKLGK
jgi:hypothetical protein